MYGLISMIGVVSRRSKPLKWMVSPSTLSMRASVSPTGFGLCGERVEKTPTLAPFSLGGATLAFVHSPAFL